MMFETIALNLKTSTSNFQLQGCLCDSLFLRTVGARTWRAREVHVSIP